MGPYEGGGGHCKTPACRAQRLCLYRAQIDTTMHPWEVSLNAMGTSISVCDETGRYRDSVTKGLIGLPFKGEAHSSLTWG